MNELLWYLSRATGVVSLVLLTVVVVLGATTAGRRRPRGEQATVVIALHRSLGLGMVAFLAVHVVTAVVETYVSIDWIAVVVPFTSGWSPGWVGLGTLALDLLLAVTVTSVCRHRLPERVWRRVHLASYLLWPAAVVHGVALGTGDQLLLRGTSVACAAVGVAAVAWRLAGDHQDRAHRRLVSAQVWS